jgi:hypothetical protein
MVRKPKIPSLFHEEGQLRLTTEKWSEQSEKKRKKKEKEKEKEEERLERNSTL